MKDSKKLAKIAIIVCAALVVAFAIGTIVIVRSNMAPSNTEPESELSISDEEAESIAQKALEEYASKKGESITDGLNYYSRDGKAYPSQSEVPFYDCDGNIFYYQTDEEMNIFFLSEATGEKLESSLCFVDKDGYFIYDDKGEITLSEDGLSGMDADGNNYCPAALALWNKDGDMLLTLE